MPGRCIPPPRRGGCRCSHARRAGAPRMGTAHGRATLLRRQPCGWCFDAPVARGGHAVGMFSCRPGVLTGLRHPGAYRYQGPSRLLPTWGGARGVPSPPPPPGQGILDRVWLDWQWQRAATAGRGLERPHAGDTRGCAQIPKAHPGPPAPPCHTTTDQPQRFPVNERSPVPVPLAHSVLPRVDRDGVQLCQEHRRGQQGVALWRRREGPAHSGQSPRARPTPRAARLRTSRRLGLALPPSGRGVFQDLLPVLHKGEEWVALSARDRTLPCCAAAEANTACRS